MSGYLIIPEGSRVFEEKGYIYYQQSKVCMTTSENGWRHFHKDSPSGNKRYKMVAALEQFTLDGGEIEYPDDYLATNHNHYWRSLIRTVPDGLLQHLYDLYIVKEA